MAESFSFEEASKPTATGPKSFSFEEASTPTTKAAPVKETSFSFEDAVATAPKQPVVGSRMHNIARW